MDKRISLLLTQLDAFFDGHSFNGPPLMKTVEAVSFDQVTSTDTFEGYSVWGVLLHVLYWKFEVAKMLGCLDPEYVFPYQAENWPALPDTQDEPAWKKLLSDTREMHGVLRTGIEELSSEQLDADIPEWKVPLEQGLLWIGSHDGYHTAQIRSMGVKGTEGDS